VLYALFASIVLGICFKTSTREMVRYGFYSFAMFVGGLIAAAGPCGCCATNRSLFPHERVEYVFRCKT